MKAADIGPASIRKKLDCVDLDQWRAVFYAQFYNAPVLSIPVCVMQSVLRRPEEILAYRSLRQILGSLVRQVWSIGPSDSTLTAVRLMAEKDIGFLPVLEGGRLVGALSERDCARSMITRPLADATLVSEIMVRTVVTVDLSKTFAECLRLMHDSRIRHLPVVESGKVIAVLSIRDLLSEAVSHHARLIEQLERERLTMFVSPV